MREYPSKETAMLNYAFKVPEKKRVRYIIHSDAKNEADDQFTIAHALMTPKLDVKGIVACHFNNSDKGYADGTTAKASYDEIIKILDLMHLEGEYPVLMGAVRGLPDESTPIDSEGARFIIEEAMKDDERPLYIGMQGAITDLASAILLEPRICDRMTAIWIGGGIYPEGGREFNLQQDINGANVVFKSSMPLWQVPSSTYTQFYVTLSELQVKVRPYGRIGNYLFQQMVDLNDRLGEQLRWPHGEAWALGDEGCVAAILEERGNNTGYRLADAPLFNADMTYRLNAVPGRKIRVYDRMDARADLEDLFAKMQINFPEKDS